MPMFGPWELAIILLIVVVIFGAGRLSQLGGAVGKSVRDFRQATKDDEAHAHGQGHAAVTTSPAAVLPGPASLNGSATTTVIAAAPVAAPGITCPNCARVNPVAQAFCSGCGTALGKAAVTVAPPPTTDVTCPSCATVNPAGQAFCGQCGARLSRAVA